LSGKTNKSASNSYGKGVWKTPMPFHSSTKQGEKDIVSPGIQGKHGWVKIKGA